MAAKLRAQVDRNPNRRWCVCGDGKTAKADVRMAKDFHSGSAGPRKELEVHAPGLGYATARRYGLPEIRRAQTSGYT